MTNSVNGKIVAITGGFGSLGLVAAQVLAERGAHVALIGRGQSPGADALPPQLARPDTDRDCLLQAVAQPELARA